MIPGIATAHGNQHDMTPRGLRPDTRREALIRTFPKETRAGYAIDNDATLVFSSTDPKIIRVRPDARTSLLENQQGQIVERHIEPEDLRIY